VHRNVSPALHTAAIERTPPAQPAFAQALHRSSAAAAYSLRYNVDARERYNLVLLVLLVLLVWLVLVLLVLVVVVVLVLVVVEVV
jgi:hypothetical protein